MVVPTRTFPIKTSVSLFDRLIGDAIAVTFCAVSGHRCAPLACMRAPPPGLLPHHTMLKRKKLLRSCPHDSNFPHLQNKDGPMANALPDPLCGSWFISDLLHSLGPENSSTMKFEEISDEARRLWFDEAEQL